MRNHLLLSVTLALGCREGADATGAARGAVVADTAYTVQRLNHPDDANSPLRPVSCQPLLRGTATYDSVFARVRLTDLDDISTPSGGAMFIAGSVFASGAPGGSHATLWTRLGRDLLSDASVFVFRDLDAIWVDRMIPGSPVDVAHTSHAYAVNDVGQVAGSAGLGGLTHAMFYDASLDLMLDLPAVTPSFPTLRAPVPNAAPKWVGMTNDCAEQSSALGLSEVQRAATSVLVPGDPSASITVVDERTVVVGSAGICGSPGGAAVQWVVRIQSVQCPSVGGAPPRTVAPKVRAWATVYGPLERSAGPVRDALWAAEARAINRNGLTAGRRIGGGNYPVLFTKTVDFSAYEPADATFTRLNLSGPGNYGAVGVSDCPPRAPVAPGTPESSCADAGAEAGAVVISRGPTASDNAVLFTPDPDGGVTALGLPPATHPTTGQPLAGSRASAITRDGSIVVGHSTGANNWATVWRFVPATGTYAPTLLSAMTTNGPSGFGEIPSINETGEMVALTLSGGFYVRPSNVPVTTPPVAMPATPCITPAGVAPEILPPGDADIPAPSTAALLAACGL